MDWLTALLQSMGPSAANAQIGPGAPTLAQMAGIGDIPAGTPTGYDESGVGAPMGPAGLPPSSTPVMPPPTPAPEIPSLGASLEPGAPNGSPMDLRSINQKRMGGSQSMPAVDSAKQRSDALVAALRGVKPPPPPDVVKPTTPHPPQQRGTIQGGDFTALLQSLSNPRRPMTGPTTLGGALGIGRY